MTDEQIIKALKICTSEHLGCEDGCPYISGECIGEDDENIMLKEALDLINRQKAEVDELTADCEKYKAERDEFANHIVRIREIAQAEAIKEFAERLKDKHYYSQQIGALVVDIKDIDNLVKEMTE